MRSQHRAAGSEALEAWIWDTQGRQRASGAPRRAQRARQGHSQARPRDVGPEQVRLQSPSVRGHWLTHGEDRVESSLEWAYRLSLVNRVRVHADAVHRVEVEQ